MGAAKKKNNPRRRPLASTRPKGERRWRTLMGCQSVTGAPARRFAPRAPWSERRAFWAAASAEQSLRIRCLIVRGEPEAKSAKNSGLDSAVLFLRAGLRLRRAASGSKLSRLRNQGYIVTFIFSSPWPFA